MTSTTSARPASEAEFEGEGPADERGAAATAAVRAAGRTGSRAARFFRSRSWGWLVVLALLLAWQVSAWIKYVPTVSSPERVGLEWWEAVSQGELLGALRPLLRPALLGEPPYCEDEEQDAEHEAEQQRLVDLDPLLRRIRDVVAREDVVLPGDEHAERHARGEDEEILQDAAQVPVRRPDAAGDHGRFHGACLPSCGGIAVPAQSLQQSAQLAKGLRHLACRAGAACSRHR